MKYKAGDKVRVIRRIPTGKYTFFMEDRSESNSINDDMKALRGKVVTISDIACGQYRIAEDRQRWLWTDEMFEGLVIDADPEPTPKPEGGPAFKVGDRVRVKRDLSDSKTYRDEKGRIHCGCVEPMLKHAGEVVTIKKVIEKDSAIYYNICEGGWNWVYEEFDGLATEETPAPEEQPHTDWSWEDLF